MYIKLPMDLRLIRPVRTGNAFDAGKSSTWASGRGLGPGNLDFLGPKYHSPNGSIPFHRAQKKSRFPGLNPLPFALVMELPVSQALRKRPYKSLVHK
jgi:hypothetical protein